MKFKGQGKINICGFEYKKNIADSRRGGGVRAPPTNPCIRAWTYTVLTLFFLGKCRVMSGVKLGSGCRLPLADSEFQDPIQNSRIRFEKRAYTNYYKLRKLIRGTNL